MSKDGRVSEVEKRLDTDKIKKELESIANRDRVSDRKEKLYTKKINKSKEYLFSWDEVPGKDSEGLLNHLVDNQKISWAKNAEIKKSDDGNTITVEKGENSLTLKLNKEEYFTINTDYGIIYKYVLKKENGKLNIYNGTVLKATVNSGKVYVEL